ncbi:MAG TPA: alginate export family protein [Candidatus Binatia bacterium]|nr:alginate export family protein [Candidatus Binatia bacterium]
MNALAALSLVLSFGAARLAAQAGSAPNSPGSSQAPKANSDPASWLFPVEKLDEHLPYWLHIGGEYRNRLEGPLGIGYAATDDFYSLDRLRINARIQPTDWLGFRGEVQDSQIFFNHHIANANPYEDKWTLWEAYPQVGNSETGWVDALAGRQVLRFGDERVIGPSEWLNVGRTFNTARFDIHHPGYKLSIFASSVVPGDSSDLHAALPGNNFYGVYGSMQNVIPRADFEPYVLWRVAPSSSALPETLGRGHLNEVTIGLHTKGKLPADFEYDTEFDGETGSLGSSSLRAWAGYVELGKTFSRTPAAPRIFVEGNYASGTKNLAGASWNTFDELYPSNHDKLGFADLVGRRNIEQFRAGVQEEPTKKWKIKQQFEDFWLATTHDNFYASSGAISVAAHPGASPHVGGELDLVAEYNLNRGLSFGFGYCRFFAGQFLDATTHGHDYTYPFAYLEYNFSRSGFHFPITTNKPN